MGVYPDHALNDCSESGKISVQALLHNATATVVQNLMRWPRLVLIVLMLTAVWYRAHTFGPHLRAASVISIWPMSVGESEPLDCDEAAYAYIAHRILQGDVMYRDLTENKPPLGYWLYTLAVAIGGYDELAIRVMPIPFILGTIGLVWWIAHRVGGPGSSILAAGLFVLLSTDPYLFGNGANMEHFINLFAVAALALFIKGWDQPDRWYLCTSGVCLGAATLIKQVAIVPALVFGVTLLIARPARDDRPRRRLTQGVVDILAFGLGLATIVVVAASILIVSGAGESAFADIFQYGRALTTDTLPEVHAPPSLIRWITGNADPGGRLPWPFGTTDYLVWWGTGSWPLWLASVPAMVYLLLSPKTTPARRLVAFWTISAWAQVTLPGLYWQHYYLLPIAGVAISVAVCFTDAVVAIAQAFRSKEGANAGLRRLLFAVISTIVLTAAIGSTLWIQVRDYLLVAPEELTIRYKGGRQWVALRTLGRDLGRRKSIWNDPHLYVWGWQSPLHFYAKLDSPTRHFFVDNLLRDQADRDHPLIQPRLEEIMVALKQRPPELIFTGYRPFGALRAFLNERYIGSNPSLGLWVKRDDYGRFRTLDSSDPSILNGSPIPRSAGQPAARSRLHSDGEATP
jgi:4-amino-4-deoxy-L-arabinose transferase-like glycosyltransferase